MVHIVPLGELDERWGRKLVLVKLSWNYKSSKNGAFKAAHPRKNGGVHIKAHVTMFSIVTCRYGARYRTRTCDPMHVKHVLYQLS